MISLMSLLAAQTAGQEVSCKWIIGGLVTAIVGMAGYIVTLHAGAAKKINDVYEGRISDLKANHELVDTLLRVVTEQRKGGA